MTRLQDINTCMTQQHDIITYGDIAARDNPVGLHAMIPLQEVMITWLRETIAYNGLAVRDNYIGPHMVTRLQRQ